MDRTAEPLSTQDLDQPVSKAVPSGIHPAIYSIAGMSILLALWWVAGEVVRSSDYLFAFADFAPAPALTRLLEMITSGEAMAMTLPSLSRVALGLLWAIVIGVPVGILIGWYQPIRSLTNMPFQFLRMISPLSCIDPVSDSGLAAMSGADSVTAFTVLLRSVN